MSFADDAEMSLWEAMDRTAAGRRRHRAREGGRVVPDDRSSR